MYGLRYSLIRIKDQQFNLNMVKMLRNLYQFLSLKVPVLAKQLALDFPLLRRKILDSFFISLSNIPINSYLFFSWVSFHIFHLIYDFVVVGQLLWLIRAPDHNSWLPQDIPYSFCMTIGAFFKTMFFKSLKYVNVI